MKVRRRKSSFRPLKTFATHGPEAAVVARPADVHDDEVRFRVKSLPQQLSGKCR
jgi:hypothetical protein